MRCLNTEFRPRHEAPSQIEGIAVLGSGFANRQTCEERNQLWLGAKSLARLVKPPSKQRQLGVEKLLTRSEECLALFRCDERMFFQLGHV